MPFNLGNLGPPVLVRRTQSRVCPVDPKTRLLSYRGVVLLMTFLAYTTYHLSRKPISVVKTELYNCTSRNGSHVLYDVRQGGVNCTSWIDKIAGHDEDYALSVLGTLDTAYLFAYAGGMFVSGIVAERVDLRYFLAFGMVSSGVMTMAFGFGRWFDIHAFGYYVFVQAAAGALSTTGWPAVVAVVANWFGRGKKGLIMGVWNSHTSVGNILGSLIAGVFVETDWGLSFFVPGAIIASLGIVLFFTLVVRPEDVNLDLDEYSPAESTLPGAMPQSERAPLLTSDDSGDDTDHGSIQRDNPVAAESARDGGEEVLASLDEGSSPAAADERPITFWGALRIPGVVEYALSLFFSKLVSYTFLFWLPTFIHSSGVNIDSEDAAFLSTLFDVGGIAGGIIAGFATDLTGKSAITCAVMLVLAVPTLFAYQSYGNACHLNLHTGDCYAGNVALLLISGLLVNGPYALITTAVSAELGMHPSLRGSSKALATVTSIIDGTGSIGAAIGPFLAGAIPGLNNVFYMLMAADVISLLLLVRLLMKEIREIMANRRRMRS